MNGTLSSPLLGRLSHEMILFCDDDLVIREANELALSTLGKRMLGRPLLQVIASMARPKGAAFIDELTSLDVEAVSATWELLLHVPRNNPLLIGLRGGRLPEGGWMIMGVAEPPRLTALYHEVLAMNNELTELVRQLTRQQAALSTQLERLLPNQEAGNVERN